MTFFAADAGGTYLSVDEYDASQGVGPATYVPLSAVGAVAGDYLVLTRSGTFYWKVGEPANADSMVAVFVDSSGGFLSCGAPSVVTLPQALGDESTDIAFDFPVGSNPLYVKVPQGAVALLVSANDSYFSDNESVGYGINVSIAKPDTGLLEFSGAGGPWTLEPNGDWLLAGPFRVNGLDVSGSATLHPDGQVVLAGSISSATVPMPMIAGKITVDSNSGQGSFTSITKNDLKFGGLDFQPSGIDMSSATPSIGGTMALPGGMALTWVAGSEGVLFSSGEVIFSTLDLNDRPLPVAPNLDLTIGDLGLVYALGKDTLTLVAKVTADVTAGTESVKLVLESNADNGFTIAGGHWVSGTVTLEGSDFKAGLFEFQEPSAEITFNAQGVSAFQVHAIAAFPSSAVAQVGSFLINGVGATIGFNLDPVSLRNLEVIATFSALSATIWGSPPIYLTKIGGGFAHAFDDEPLELSAQIGFLVMPINMHIDLDAKGTKNGLAGAVEGYVVNEQILSFEGEADWRWGSGSQFKASGEISAFKIEFTNPLSGNKVSMENGLLHETGVLTANGNWDIVYKAKGEINLPFLPGLSSKGEMLQVINDGNSANDFLQVWGTLNLGLFSKTLGLRVFFDGSASLIGEKEVPLFHSWIIDDSIADITMHARWDVASTSAVHTRVVIYDDLEKTKVREIIGEAEYSSHGIVSLAPLNDEHNAYVWVTSVLPGVYDLEVLDSQGLGTLTYSATTTERSAEAVVTSISVATAQAQIAFAFDKAPQAGTALRFFLDTDGTGYDGIMLGTVASPGASGLFTADLSGLAPGEYSVYTLADTGGIPQFSYASVPLDFVTSTATPFDDLLTGTDGADFFKSLAGNDRVDLKAGDDYLQGGPGTDTAIVFTPFTGMSSIDRSGSVIDVDTVLGHKHLVDVERIQLKGTTVYFDTGVNEPAWQAYVLLKAGIGAAPPASVVGLWLPVATADVSMASLAQQMLDYYAPGVPTASLVQFLFQQVLHVAPTPDQASFVIGLVGPGNYFENNGELFAYAASMDSNAAGGAFTGQPYVLSY